jgi:RNA polymerase sigma factor (TIGR02999 family)
MVHDDIQHSPDRDDPAPTGPVAPAHAAGDVTRILSQIEQGEPQAAEQLLPLVYDELRKLAAGKMAREEPGQTLQATALVHEAYIRLVDVDKARHWDSRGHFFAAAAEAMRRILVDRARQKNSLQAGGMMERIDLDQVDVESKDGDGNLLALNEALEKLEQIDPRRAQLVKLRFFAGLSIPAAANVLGIANSTAIADWAYAKGWLRVEMSGPGGSRSGA